MYILIIQKRLNEVYYVFCARYESTLFSNVLLKRRLVLRKMFCEQTGCKSRSQHASWQRGLLNFQLASQIDKTSEVVVEIVSTMNLSSFVAGTAKKTLSALRTKCNPAARTHTHAQTQTTM